MSIIKEGYLVKSPMSWGVAVAAGDVSKRSRIFMKRDHKRYFVLKDDGFLYYYTDSDFETKTPKGVINLKGKNTQVTEVNTSGLLVTPSCRHEKYQLFVTATSAKERNDWKESFLKLIENKEEQEDAVNQNRIEEESKESDSESYMIQGDSGELIQVEIQEGSEVPEIFKEWARRRENRKLNGEHLPSEEEISEIAKEWEKRCKPRWRRRFFPPPPPVRKEGYLCVKIEDEDEGSITWNLRYFVLAKHLTYYQSKENYVSKAEAGTSFDLTTKTCFLNRNCPTEVCIRTLGSRCLDLRAETEEEALEWQIQISGTNNIKCE